MMTTAREKKLTREMLSWTDSVWHTEGVPKRLRELSHSIHKDIREMERVGVGFKRFPAPTVGGPRSKAERSTFAQERIAQKTDRFAKLVKKSPKYSSIEFNCLGDYEKCKQHRGEYDIHCRFVYFICMARKIIPFVRQK
jgi:hypothetical protein